MNVTVQLKGESAQGVLVPSRARAVGGRMSRRYATVQLKGGPAQGALVPFYGPPQYGFCLQQERHVDGGLFRRPRDEVDIYRINGRAILPDGVDAQASFIGTVVK